jgi:ribosome-associated GTPase EngA
MMFMVVVLSILVLTTEAFVRPVSNSRCFGSLGTSSSINSNLIVRSVSTRPPPTSSSEDSAFALDNKEEYDDDEEEGYEFDMADFEAMEEEDEDEGDDFSKMDPVTVVSKSKPSSASKILGSSNSNSVSDALGLKPIRRYQAKKKEPLIAIVGRPNVGKSALVNRIAGTQSGGAIVADESGITRDRTYRDCEFLGEVFQLVDTGGLVFDDSPDTLFAKEIREQAMVAIQESSGVILVVDGQVGLTSMDREIAEFLRTEIYSKLPIRIAVNKCESETTGALSAAEFWNLGLGEPTPVSALHGVGTAELLEGLFDDIVQRKSSLSVPALFGEKVQRLKDAKKRKNSKKQLPGEDDVEYKLRKYGIGDIAQQVAQEYDDAKAAFDQVARPEEINIAIVGRPNVGKSSLLNKLFGSTRAIVSDMAGTTRDSIDAIMERPPPDGSEEGTLPTLYRFVDTAGIRRKGKVEFGPEFFMVNRALRAIRRADVGEFYFFVVFWKKEP